MLPTNGADVGDCMPLSGNIMSDMGISSFCKNQVG